MSGMGKLTDVLLGRSDKQRARIDRAKADAKASREALRDRVTEDRAQMREDWQDTKEKARRQSRGQE